MNDRLKKTLIGITLGALMLPVLAACSGQSTTQGQSTTTESVPDTTTTQVPNTTTTPVPNATTTPVSPAPGVQGSPTSGGQSTANNVVDLIDKNPSLRTLASTIDKADLQDTLKQSGPYTIFAPSDVGEP